MGQEVVHKVVKTDKLSNRVKLAKVLGRKRWADLMDNKVIEVSRTELDLLKKSNWVTLKTKEE